MPLPNMIRFPKTTTSIIPDLMNGMVMMSSTTNMKVLNDQWASMNDTMVAVLATDKYCTFPAYLLSVWMVIFTRSFVHESWVTVTPIVLYLSAEVKNVKNIDE